MAEPARTEVQAIPTVHTTADSADAIDAMRIRYGAWIIVAGFVLLAVVVVGGLVRFDSGGEVSKVVLAVTGLMGTVIGAFFGVQAGSSGKERAEKNAKDAQARADHHADLAKDHATKEGEAKTRGRALAAAVRARVRGSVGTRASIADQPQTEPDELLALADELFPPE